jgi:hypothetical protein
MTRLYKFVYVVPLLRRLLGATLFRLGCRFHMEGER